MKLWDAHVHVQDEALAGGLDGVLARAAAAGVAAMTCNGTQPSDWDAVAAIARRHPCVRPAYGLHPWNVAAVAGAGDGWLADLEARLRADPAASVGEIGLDHAIEPRDDALQEAAFLAQLRLARDLGRPASIHCRRAWGRMPELLAAFGSGGPGWVIHSYSGGAELAPVLAKGDVYFSFSGSVTWSGNRKSHRAAQAVPADRLLVETDSPDILPAGLAAAPAEGRAPPNEPANLPRVLAAVASLRGWSGAEAAEATWANAARVFGRGV